MWKDGKMKIEEILEDIDIAVNLEGASECSCDPEVGWRCERCFIISTLENAKLLLAPPMKNDIEKVYCMWCLKNQPSRFSKATGKTLCAVCDNSAVDLPCCCAEIESAGVVNPDCPCHGAIRANR
jgi:hypothetical protein